MNIISKIKNVFTFLTYYKLLVEKEPIVAMLSHSTMGSAKHSDVDKVIEATRIAKEQYPEIKQQQALIEKIVKEKIID